MDEVNTLYWQGKAVGTEAGGVIQWYPSAPREAMATVVNGEASIAIDHGMTSVPQALTKGKS